MIMFLPFLLATLLPGASESPVPHAETRAWEEAASFLFNDSHKTFSELPDRKNPEVRLGLAATLLNLQPRTPKNLENAAAIIEELARTEPADSQVALLARFLEARMAENYVTPPQPRKAMDLYREIVSRKTGLSLLEISASRLVILTAFASESEPENLAALQALEPLSGDLSTPEGLREFHLSMAFALLENDGEKTRILEHFKKADQIGFLRKENSIHTWLVMARLSQEVGQLDQAASYYRKFLEHFPNDPKAFGIKQRLDSLKSHGNN